VLLVALPRGLGQLMLGNIWRPTYPLVLPTTFYIMSGCATAGALVGLHALAASRRSMRAVILTSLLVITCSIGGALFGGTVGTMILAATASWFGTVVAWWQFRLAMHERTAPL
jgi:hypothetical protein